MLPALALTHTRASALLRCRPQQHIRDADSIWNWWRWRRRPMVHRTVLFARDHNVTWRWNPSSNLDRTCVHALANQVHTYLSYSKFHGRFTDSDSGTAKKLWMKERARGRGDLPGGGDEGDEMIACMAVRDFNYPGFCMKENTRSNSVYWLITRVLKLDKIWTRVLFYEFLLCRIIG